MKKKRHEVIDLLLALRREGISCAAVTVGGVTLDGIIDTKAGADTPASKPEPRLSMWDANVEALKNLPASPNDDVPEEAKID